MRSSRWLAAATLAVAAGACESGNTPAYGDANSIIMVVPDDVWAQVGDSVSRALEPRVYTVREERTFRLTQVSPHDEDWLMLRRFRQLVVIGEATDSWVAIPLATSDEPVPEAPTLVVREDVWARGQVVTVMVLPPGGGAPAVAGMVPALQEVLDSWFRAYARQRMFASGRNDALSDTLRMQASFGLLLPNVYRWRQVADTAYMFINDFPTAEQLVRSILVVWREGSTDLPGAEEMLAQRQRLSDAFYDWAQGQELDRVDVTELDRYAGGAREVRSVWTGQIEGFPQAGPFILRAVACPSQDRVYLLDAWLYAPSRDKYEYILQLETILDSFECGG